MADTEKTPLLEQPQEEEKILRSHYGTRWLVLALSCLLMIGNYYCYDNPAALNLQLQNYFQDTEYGGSGWQEWFALMYSVYSFPNIILPFIGGFLVDFLGVRMMLVIFNLFILGGQLLFAFGIAIKSVPVVLVGRTVFGFGGESLTVAQSALVAVWFQNKEMAFALGINLSIARLGGVINNILSPILWNSGHLSMWIGAIICGASLGVTLLLVPIDKRMEKKLEKVNGESATVKSDEKISLTDVRYFKAPFWLLTVSCIVVYGTVLPFNNVASAFLQHRDFMPQEKPWKDNRTYVLPRDCSIFEANKTMCDLDNSNSTLHAHFWLKNHSLPQANVTNCNSTNIPPSALIPGTCAPGYELDSNTTTLEATCCAATGNMTLTSKSGKCVPKKVPNGTRTCAATSWELNAVFPMAGNSTSGKVTAKNCTYGYTFYRHNISEVDVGPSVAAVCDTTTGFWDAQGNGSCVPIANNYSRYCKAQDKAESAANRAMSIPYIISAVISPFLGFLIDRIGKRAILATLAPCVLILVHSLLSFTSITPYVPLVGQGLAYSIFAAALWPSIPYVVDEQYVGTAYGLLTALQNGGLALFPLIVGKILSGCENAFAHTEGEFLSVDDYNRCLGATWDYKWSEVFFVGLAGLGMLVGLVLNWDDHTNRGDQLNRSKKAKLAAQAAQKAASDAEKIN